MQLAKSPGEKSNQYDTLKKQPELSSPDSIQVERRVPTQRYKSFASILKIVINISLSSFYFGYVFAYLSTIDFETISKIYHVQKESQFVEGLLIACVSLGGGIGAIASRFLIQKFSRRQSLLIVNFLAFFSGLLIFVPNLQVLILSRILQGICAGLFSSPAPLIIKQFSPREVSGTLASCNQIFISFGIFFAFAFSAILAKMFNDPKRQKTWWIVFGFGSMPLLLQSLLLTTKYNFETPQHLFETNRDDEGKQLISMIYKEEFVDQVVKEMLESVGRDEKEGKEGQDVNQEKERVSLQTPKSAIFVAIHLAALQQFCGINAVMAYGGQIVGEDIPSLKLTLPIIINFEQVIASLFTSYLLTKIGRKTICQFGSLGAGFSCTMIAVGFWIKDQYRPQGFALIIAGLVVFMANFGLTLGPVVWVYLPELVKPSTLPFATAMNWGSAVVVMMLFQSQSKNFQTKIQLYCLFFLPRGASFLFVLIKSIWLRRKINRKRKLLKST